jgi:hypothetical protein
MERMGAATLTGTDVDRAAADLRAATAAITALRPLVDRPAVFTAGGRHLLLDRSADAACNTLGYVDVRPWWPRPGTRWGVAPP